MNTSTPTKKQYIPSFKGGHHTEEAKKKLSEAKMGVKNGYFGKKHTPEILEKMRIAATGRKQTLEVRKKMSAWQIGRKMSLEARSKMSASWKMRAPISIETRQKMSDARKGEKNHNWKGGVATEAMVLRKSFETKLWREACMKRDNYTCQKTGQVGGKLEVHHIQNFADFSQMRTSIENGITLSKEAHALFHKIYGKKNNTRAQLNKFLNDKTI